MKMVYSGGEGVDGQEVSFFGLATFNLSFLYIHTIWTTGGFIMSQIYRLTTFPPDRVRSHRHTDFIHKESQKVMK